MSYVCAALPAIEIRELPHQHTATVRTAVSPEATPATLGRIYRQVMAAIAKQNVGFAGPPFARYHSLGEKIDLEAGFAVSHALEPDGDVRPGELPAGPAGFALHEGSYDTLDKTYEALRTRCAREGRSASGGHWECYLTDPKTTPDPAEWRTEVYLPLSRE